MAMRSHTLVRMSLDAGRPASPYSTGGGGTVLEHRYGATLLAALLMGDPLPELGDKAIPFCVRFQASAESAVDDLLITGRTPDGGERRVSVGVRRVPEFTSKHQKTAALLAGYVRIVAEHWDEVRVGRWRLALATGSRDEPLTEVNDLAMVAATRPNDLGFRTAVMQEGWSKAHAGRLKQVDDLVRLAASQPKKAGLATAGIDPRELTWRVLSSLTLRELRLEGPDVADRTTVVGRLRNVTWDKTPAAANELFDNLFDLVGTYAPAGAVVTEEMLRRDLSGVRLGGGGVSRPAPPVAAVLLAGARTEPHSQDALDTRWQAGEEGWLGGRRYVLQHDKSGLLRADRDSGGLVRRQAFARQTDPEPEPGHRYVWLRQGGKVLTRERDLLTRARPTPGLPKVAHYQAVAGLITLALSWPAEKQRPPSETVQAKFALRAPNEWQVHLLLEGLASLTRPLGELHRLKTSHRNLAPDGILDVGNKRFALRDTGLAATGYRAGEGPESYQAPEQAYGARMAKPGPATDVYHMPIRPVQFRSSLVLIAGSANLQSQLDDLASREGFPRSPYEIEAHLNALTVAGGVPVTLDKPLPGKTAWSVLVHARRYVIRLFLSGKYQDAYSIASISPLRLRDHQRLAAGYLLTRPARWVVVSSVGEIPQGADPGWGALTSGWDTLASMATTAPPTEEENGFLGTLGEVIDATERITTATESGTAYPYREAKPTGGARSGATQWYEFALAGSAAPDDGAFVQVVTRDSSGTGAARARGQVTRVNETQVTIRFDEPVDWNDLRGQGEVSTTASTVVYRMQREALRQLRTGRARNPGVLQALVEGKARLFVPPQGRRNAAEPPPEPAFELNKRQREAFDKTLTSPDILTVIGPPGTGKTTTITEIVRAVAGRRERVIVCSQNNRAVDNVLGRLSRELLTIRVGNEARITEEGLPYLLQRQASELRTQTLNKSRRTLNAYEHLDDAKRWAGELAGGNAALTQARVIQAQALHQLDSARREAGGPATEELDRCAAVQAEAGRAVHRSEARARRLRQLSDLVAPWSAWVLIGWLFALLATRWTEKGAAERVQSGALAEALQAAAVALNAAQQHLIDVTRDVAPVVAAKGAADEAMTQANQAHAKARWAARSAILAIEATDVTPPPVRDDEDADLAAAQAWLAEWLPRLAARQELLTAWAREAAAPGDACWPAGAPGRPVPVPARVYRHLGPGVGQVARPARGRQRAAEPARIPQPGRSRAARRPRRPLRPQAPGMGRHRALPGASGADQEAPRRPLGKRGGDPAERRHRRLLPGRGARRDPLRLHPQ